MPASPGEIAPRRFGLPHPRHFFALSGRIDLPRGGAAVFENNSGSHRRRARQHVARRRVRRLSRGSGNPARLPALDERFLPPRDFVWGSFTASDGAVLRWGHLPVPESIREARAACVIAVGFGEFIEKHFETMRDLAARGIAVWCLDWRGQGRSIRPSRFPTRPRARNFNRDAEDLAEFTRAYLPPGLPRLLVAHSMGGAIALVCLRRHPGSVRRRGAVRADGRAAHRTPAADAGARADRAGARRRARPPLYPGCAGMAPRPRADAADQPRDDRRRALPAASCLVFRRPGAAAGPGDLWLGGQRAGPGRAHLETGISRRDPHPDPDRPAGTRAGRLPRGATRRAAALLPNCRLVALAGSKHDPFLECDAVRDYWFDCLDRFIAERLAEIPSDTKH